MSEMTMRDQFAMAALTGILAGLEDDVVWRVSEGIKGGAIEAKAAYGWADAMLKARSTKDNE